MSVLATAFDHLADVYASLVAVVGIAPGLLGRDFLGDGPHTETRSPAPSCCALTHGAFGAINSRRERRANIVGSLLVLKLAVERWRESVDNLREHNESPEKLVKYAALLRTDDHVKRIERGRAREHGHYIIVGVRSGHSPRLYDPARTRHQSQAEKTHHGLRPRRVE
ncbi:hypothetical protein [Cohnella sp.]|uniref:hypothetical protein n=1 Tax=Cohnella sp. TaxID=1883426 RepID=UPI00356A7EBA